MSKGWLIAHYVWTEGGNLAAGICCALAFWLGGSAERRGAGILLGGWLLTLLVVLLHIERIYGVHAYIMAIDTAVLVGFTALSLWSRKPWTIFLAAFQLNDVMTHVVELMFGMDTYTYVTLIGFWGGWALLPPLMWGTWQNARQARPIKPSAPAGSAGSQAGPPR